ncbi:MULTISPECIES: hypothetical protein [Frankia]|uniref:hypothetical protein n=1 Tax=Frankia TaxID=1854 RepID=UPI0006EC109D|nr:MULTISPECIES: hypothetical protein [Frankia]
MPPPGDRLAGDGLMTRSAWWAAGPAAHQASGGAVAAGRVPSAAVPVSAAAPVIAERKVP